MTGVQHDSVSKITCASTCKGRGGDEGKSDLLTGGLRHREIAFRSRWDKVSGKVCPELVELACDNALRLERATPGE
jgi:hypothetical protein